MPRFIDGVIKFQNEVYPDKKELFERLAKGQEPEAVFIACSDARVETAMITQTDPGELSSCAMPAISCHRIRARPAP